MQTLEVSGAVRPLYGSLGVKGLIMLQMCVRFCYEWIILYKILLAPELFFLIVAHPVYKI